ncbi:MAG TPA: hypothetical protein VK105_20345 [Virgibacillus sp.]|nr:hypothetical protein [Virgibacillus sp.]HLR69444.1 hypothetical protein [Virgibacillus sp.]
MQLSLFEDVDIKQEGIEFVTNRIIQSDSIRNYIKQAIEDNDRQELIKLFNESIRTFGFSGPDCWSWFMGGLETPNRKQRFKITARELADMALKIYK